MISALLVGLLSLQEPSPAPPVPGASERAPMLREIVLEGVTFFTREEALKGIRLRPGRFHRDPDEVAASLRAHYEAQCFMSVRVAARFDREAGRLTLTVDEGRMHALVLEGLEGDAEVRMRAVLGIEPGTPLRDKTVRDAMARLEAATGGAYRIAGGPPWTVEEGPDGRILHLRIERRRFRLTPLLSGPDAAPYHNRVDGTSPGLGVDVTLYDGASVNHTSVYLRGSYAFAAEYWRYALGVRRSFGADQLLTVGYERHDMTDTDDLFRRRPLEGPRSRPWVFHIVDDYFERRGDEAYVFVRPSARAHVGVSFRSDVHGSLPVTADDSILAFTRREPRPNPEVDDGLMRSVLVSARWARHETLFPSWQDERDSFLLRTPYGSPFEQGQGARLEATYEVASSEALGGDFSFQRFIGQARATRGVGTRHTVTGRVIAGLTGGDPPRQRRFALGGLGTLRGYAIKEFAGGNMLLATAEWAAATRPRFPSLVAFYDGGGAWTAERGSWGWKSDAGVGLQWRVLRRGWARVDLAFPFQPAPGADRARVYGMIRLPF